jgi:alpha-glucosidase (family GH31 glycosyl hydrolase)
MSGWASNNKNGIKDKQPYLFGEPFTSINRKYLKLKQRLTPYMYTLCNEAYQTGVPSVRGLILEYPDDPVTWGKATKYEYLLGKDFLVAPVYKPEDRRDSIYFPKGKWIDYWDGTEYRGESLINNYHAPLDKLPLFVRSGAIIPMYQQMYYDWERPTDTLTLDIYPDGHSKYEMYEDDGLTREHREGVYAKTKYEVNACHKTPGEMNVVLNAAEGDFNGRLKQRVYILEIHTQIDVNKILLNGKKIKKQKSEEGFEKVGAGWYYNPGHKNGTLFVKTEYLSTDQKSIVEIQ